MAEAGDAGTLVLVAEDDEDIRELVVFRLQQAGYTVIPAEDGQVALELARERKPQLAVLDVMMPKLDGIELTRSLRSDPELGEMSIILLTASVQEAAVAKGFEAGADDYIRKPFSPPELLARIQAVLARRQT
jgi:DNA-binding response OmpR family regulator